MPHARRHESLRLESEPQDISKRDVYHSLERASASEYAVWRGMAACCISKRPLDYS